MKTASGCAVLSAIILSALEFASPLYAYAPLKHEIVGAIADERLAKTPTAGKFTHSWMAFPSNKRQ